MPTSLRRQLFVIVLCVLATSCLSVPHKVYHQCAEPITEKSYSLAYVEFDDQGSHWDDTQLDRAIELIDRTNTEFARKINNRNAGGIFIIFVHGWRNDASPHNARQGNLFNFKKELEDIAKEEERMAGDQARPVVGIYLAWRGDSLKGYKALDLFDVMFTFWGRNAAAKRIASRTPATNTLLLLLKTIRGSSEARSIVVGHSMGALIIERAISQALAGIIIESVYSRKTAEGECPPMISAPADLVVMVNSAAPAFQAKDLVETFDIAELRDCEVTYGSLPQQGIRKPPLLVSVTALNDRATKAAFPIGTRLGTQGQFYQHDEEPPQQYLATRTPGHTLALHSHKLLDFDRNVERCGDSPSRVDLCEAPSEKTLSFSVADLAGTSASRYTLTRYDEEEEGRRIFNRDSPYWIMNAPKEVIDGHSEIFKQEFRDFLRGLILVTGAGQRGPRENALQFQEKRTE